MELYFTSYQCATTQLSPEFVGKLLSMLETVETEYRRPICGGRRWTPAQKECFELAHQGLSGLLENGVLTYDR